jgi:ubiquinone biosynthesis protein
MSHAARIALRGLQIGGAAVRSSWTFVREIARGGDDAWGRAAGQALVRGAISLGATFIKIGQIASTRADLLTPAVVRELSVLRDRVPAFEFVAVRRTIEEDFGASLESLFASFDPAPVAAASVAQVHRAVRRAGGDVVAVKVRRPDILERIDLDRSILLFLGRALERLVPTLRLVSLEGALRVFCEAVEQQTHLGREAENNRRFAANFAGDDDVHFPRL